MLYGFLLWIALTLAVLGLVAYRYFVSLKEDDLLHLADAEAPLIAEQNAMERRLSRIDHWRRQLTFVDVALGLCLGTVFVYDGLRRSGLL